MRIQKIDDRLLNYYQSTKYSSWVMATGQNSFVPFANVEAENLRNYTKGQNLFLNNQGRVLALKANLFSPNFGRLKYQDSDGLLTIADDLNSFINQGRIIITQDSKTVHEDLLSSLIEPIPQIVTGEKVGTPTNTYRPMSISGRIDSSVNVKNSTKYGAYFTPPLIVGQGRTINFVVQYPSTYSIPASLNNHVLQFILVTEELPQENISQARV
jgi:hypothetical protein